MEAREASAITDATIKVSLVRHLPAVCASGYIADLTSLLNQILSKRMLVAVAIWRIAHWHLSTRSNYISIMHMTAAQ